MLLLSPGRGAEATVEDKVKAALLTKFPLFVEWPAAAFTNDTAPFVIGILGPDPFGAAFETAAQEIKIGQRGFRLLRFSSLAETERDALKACHILFVSDAQAPTLPEVRARVAGAPVLTVSDAKDFAKAGGIIEFVKEKGRFRFDINLARAREAELKLSSKILQVSQVVER